MPKWIDDTLCTANIKGRYNKPIGRCGIYGVNDGKMEYRCRDCSALFRENKTRTYPVQENKPALPCEDYPELYPLSKRSGDKP